MQKAKALKTGDVVGLIAPSGPIVDPKRLKKAAEIVEEMGFVPKFGKHTGKVYGYLAGSDEERLEDLHTMFDDDGVDGIFCLKGGYGTPRIANRVNIDIIKANPKLFAGYSDITTLHILLNQKADLITFHAPMPVSDFIDGASDFTRESFLKAVKSKEALGSLENPKGEEMYTMSEGKASAVICGGNLDLISLSMGTPYEIDTKGKILFIEEIGEEPYSIDGMLSSMRNAGKLEECAGILLGDFKDAEPRNTNPSLTVQQAIEDALLPLGIPILANFRAGHCEPKITFPLGVMVEMDATNKRVTVLENACV